MKRISIAFGVLILAITLFEIRATRVTPAPIAPPAQHPSGSISAEGRVVTYPGAEVTVGTDVGGTIARMAVVEKDVVHKGDVIASIKADDTRAALVEARSHVAEAEADLRLSESERDRARSLWSQDVGSRQAWERAERDIDAARARRASALATVRRLEAVVAKTEIVAPIDGVVISRIAQPGETVPAGAPDRTPTSVRVNG
ncbi:MAG: efflux RND transporter periplasmic adaptor subunit, partial [Acidobacteriota bacterium]